MMRCNDARLEKLLTEDESSAEYRSTANHVEQCARCQRRLVELSSDDLVEIRDFLSANDETDAYQGSVNSSVAIAIEAGAGEDSYAECEPVSLDFLEPPSHPEMLGRIGRYEVERMIGSGGMGIVLKGFDTELHRVVAIKVLKPHLAHIGAARHRFAREAQSAAAVVHEHVIPIYDVQSDNKMPFLVMQYVPGQSLQARVDERGPLDPKEILRIARQVAAGLSAAHAQGLVHRDVKPANILMEESVERVLISDFGLARTVDDATLTRTGIVAGTPHYMSPEQASGQVVDHRSDLFSLGSAIYFMSTGRPPFRAEHALAILNRICHTPHRPVDEVNPDIPPELAEIVDRLLAKEPGDRFRNAREVELSLESVLVQLQRGKRSRRLRWQRGWLRWRATVKKTALVVTAISTCILIGVGLGGGFQSTDRSTAATPKPISDTTADHSTRATPPAASTETTGQSNSSRDQSTEAASADEDLANGIREVTSKVDELEKWWSSSKPAQQQSALSVDGWTTELSRILSAIQDLEQNSTLRNDNRRPLPIPEPNKE